MLDVHISAMIPGRPCIDKPNLLWSHTHSSTKWLQAYPNSIFEMGVRVVRKLPLEEIWCVKPIEQSKTRDYGRITPVGGLNADDIHKESI